MIGKTMRSAASAISITPTSGRIIREGFSKFVTRKGSHLGSPSPDRSQCPRRFGGLRNSLVSHSEPVRQILRVSSRLTATTDEILPLQTRRIYRVDGNE